MPSVNRDRSEYMRNYQRNRYNNDPNFRAKRIRWVVLRNTRRCLETMLQRRLAVQGSLG